jgi:CspA family cold shock protein
MADVKTLTGEVKMFNKEKGYGFIHSDDGQDVFFHYSALIMDGYKTVEQHDKVEFEIEQSDRGPRAKNIKKI